jgi:alkanesulfonate monooxygenase SsuD/methylene tetrahydromethanopterin reductase-like flavin-dependent oxidoreductase (luciferase family)
VTQRRHFGENPFELGLFSFNVQNGMAQLKEELWDASWEHNVALAREAEAAGLEFLLPLGRWQGVRGYPLELGNHGANFETLTWAAGILASTSRIHAFGTLHVAYVNPTFAAKQIVTAHHIGAGRFGLNVVSGTVAKDFAMFGLQPGDHDSQYDYTEEWVTIAKRLWSEEAPFDFDGRYFQLKGAVSVPKPFGGKRPMLISAGHSHRGRAFAMRHADALFTSISEIDTAAEELRAARAAAPDGANVPIYGSSHMVTRRTASETDEWYHHLVYELGAWDGIDERVEKRMANRTAPYASMQRLKERLVSGTGTFLIKGSYDDVAQTFVNLHAAGFDGMAVGLNSYLTEFATMRDEILPRLERLGLRKPFKGVPA